MKVWHLLVLLTGGTAAVVTRPDRWIRDRVAHGIVWGASAGSVDSLQRENGALKERMMQFERLSAEKDTLLSELREAHLLIEGVATELRQFAAGDSVRVVEAGDDEGSKLTTREIMIRRLEAVRRHLAEMEDSSRVRGERLAEVARENESLRATVEEHLRTMESQRLLMTSYVERIGQLETEVLALAERNQQLTLEKEVLADSLQRLAANAKIAYYVVGTREELLRAGVLTEEGGVFSRLGRTLTPSRRMARTVFTRIDREHDTVLRLPPGHSYRIISQHDAYYVDFPDDQDEEPAMRIRDPERFWATSDYLIIVRR